MIRTYTVKELEDLSGLTRRTIGDYVSKGLLSGPSHRGRGACYSQADVDILRVIPRLRVLMKKDFPTLRALRNFLAQLSSRDLHNLARKTNPDAFTQAIRELRLRLLLTAMFPQASMARIERVLSGLSPEQIRSIDGGRSQLGSVIDMSSLLQGEADDLDADGESAFGSPVQGNGHPRRHNGSGGNGLGYRPGQPGAASNGAYSRTDEPESSSSWSVSWLQGQGEADDAEAGRNIGSGSAPVNSRNRTNGSTHFDSAIASDLTATTSVSAGDRLSDISRRLERLERLLTTE